jgi:glycosyltransferase involved in cell wall biosynthesis
MATRIAPRHHLFKCLLIITALLPLLHFGAPSLRASTRPAAAWPPLKPPARPTLPTLRRTFFGARVVVLTHEFSRSGAPIACVQLAQLLSLAGASVRLFGWDAQRLPPAELAAFSASIVPAPAFSTEAVDANFDGFAADADLVVVSSAVSHQAAWVARFRAAAAARGARQPRIVWWLHEGAGSELPQDAVAGAAALLARSGALDGVLFVSSAARAFWEREVRREAGVELSALPLRQYVLRWGVPDWPARGDSFLVESAAAAAGAVSAHRRASRAARGIAAGDFVFLALASFQAIKGHAGMARAFASARNRCGSARRLRFVMAGVGYGWNDPTFFPQADVAWVRSDADFVLEGPTERPLELLLAADAYVSNTLGGGESWGLSTLSAMAAGIPVLASSAGATAEQMQHGVTALVHAVPPTKEEPQDVEELAGHMCALVEDAELRKRLGTASKAHVKNELGHMHLETSLTAAFGPLLLKRVQ